MNKFRSTEKWFDLYEKGKEKSIVDLLCKWTSFWLDILTYYLMEYQGQWFNE